MNKLLILILATVISSYATTISGRILDAETNEPIEHVNVYLANTMMGDVSDAGGRYEIKVKPGDYQLVASFMGYKPGVLPVHIHDHDLIINLPLQVQPIDMPEITVSASQARKFKHQLLMFKRFFLGQTNNARSCTIENPEYLNFTESKGYLLASCDVPLQITNHALGFELNIVIQQFKWTKADVGGVYVTHPQFIDLSGTVDKDRRKKWQQARLDTYKNSSREFFANIYHHEHTLDFSYSWKDESDTRYPMFVKNCDYFNIDTLQLVDRRQLHIQHELLKIYGRNHKQSVLKLRSNKLIIDRYGLVTNYDAFITTGYWGTLRMADALPLDYVPNE